MINSNTPAACDRVQGSPVFSRMIRCVERYTALVAERQQVKEALKVGGPGHEDERRAEQRRRQQE